MTQVEKWMPVHDFENNYKISSLGKIFNIKRGRLLKPVLNKSGYYTIRLCKDGKKKGFFFHRLLAIHFIPNPENKPFINHKNGVRGDNRLSNLEWCTQKENIHHYHTVLKMIRGVTKTLLIKICDYAFPISPNAKSGTIDKRHRLANMVKQYAEGIR